MWLQERTRPHWVSLLAPWPLLPTLSCSHSSFSFSEYSGRVSPMPVPLLSSPPSYPHSIPLSVNIQLAECLLQAAPHPDCRRLYSVSFQRVLLPALSLRESQGIILLIVISVSPHGHLEARLSRVSLDSHAQHSACSIPGRLDEQRL